MVITSERFPQKLCAAFPASAHDDQVDAMTQALTQELLGRDMVS
jgi:phage terminase large subunit-like protein